VDPDEDPVGWAAACGQDDSVLIASSSGRVLMYPAAQLRASGRTSGAVKVCAACTCVCVCACV